MATSSRRTRFVTVVCLLVLLLSVYDSSRASSFWQWTDGRGQTHITDSLEKIPAEFRDRATPLNAGSNSQATAAPRRDAKGAPPSQAAKATPVAPTSNPGSQLKRIEVPYIAQEGSAQRVIVDVTFNNTVTAQMLLDTGSPGLVISLDLADRLGLFSESQGTLIVGISGFGGDALAIRTIIDSISIGAAVDSFVPTKVVPEMSSAYEGVLGMDFMSSYGVSIDSEKLLLVLQERAPDPAARGGHSESWWRKVFSEFRAARDGWAQRATLRNLSERSLWIANFQARQAEVLYQRLEVHASEHGVPREWR